MPIGAQTELSKLANAAGAAEDKLSLIGAAVANVSIGQFNIDGVVGLSATPGYVTGDPTGFGYNTTFSVEMRFSGASARIARITDKAVNPNLNPGNFTWSLSSTVMPLLQDRGFRQTYRNTYFPGALNCNSTLPVIITSKYYDQGFNDHATNYDTTLATFVTLYSPPTPSIAYVSGTQPPRPCSGGGGCGGATITVSVDHGSYGNVAGTSSDMYLNDVLQGTTTAASFTYTELVGSTSYTAYSINNFGCQSGTPGITFTTPAYV